MRNFAGFRNRVPLLLPACAALIACGHPAPEAGPSAAADPIAVTVEKLDPLARAETYEAVGTVRAEYSAAVSSKIVSYIRRIHAQVGGRVREGQLLVELDDQDLASNLKRAEAAKAEAEQAIEEASHALASAEAQRELAEVTHKRYTELLEKDSVSRHEYDEVEAKLRSARAAVEMVQARRRQAEAKRAQAEAQIQGARVTLGYATIHAPFSGVVTERPLDAGALAAPGMPILKIEQAGRHRLEAALPESRLAGVRVGQRLPVRIASVSEILQGRVAEIVPEVQEASRTSLVRISLPRHSALRTGMFGRAVFPAGERTVLTVPASAVAERGQIQSVFVVEDQIARRRLVSLGSLIDNRYEVLSGLSAGEQVILSPGAVTDGHAVRVERVVPGAEKPSPADGEGQTSPANREADR